MCIYGCYAPVVEQGGTVIWDTEKCPLSILSKLILEKIFIQDFCQDRQNCLLYTAVCREGFD